MSITADRLSTRVLPAAAHYRLGIPRTPIGGRTGELLGSGTGSSLEFQDYREYAPGDDPRHVDWAAYARSDTLMVRLYREEVRPRVEILVDVSRSMAVDAEKLQRTRELGGLFLHLALGADAEPRLWTASEPSAPRSLEEAGLAPEEFRAPQALLEGADRIAARLRRRSLRYVVSDFLFPHDADALVRHLARGAAALTLIQLLAPEEAQPSLNGGHRLCDVETGTELNLMVGPSELESYRARLARLQYALARAARRVRATFIVGSSDKPLDLWCREELCKAGVIEPK